MNERFLAALQGSWPWRWSRSLLALGRGIRLSPGAALLGRAGAFRLAHNVAIGRGSVVRCAGAGTVFLGEGVWLAREVDIETATELRIGAGTTVQRRCSLQGTTTIGRHCILAPNVFVSSGSHPFRAVAHLPIRAQERVLRERGELAGLDRPVVVQDDCWLGVNAVIGPGVTVGKGSVVGANAVVTRDVAPYTVVAGCPAKAIGKRLEWRPGRVFDAGDPEHEPYRLGGRRVANGTVAAAIAVDAAEPLRVVLAGPARALRVRVRAGQATRLVVAGSMHPVAAGASELEVELPAETGRQTEIVVDAAVPAGAAPIELVRIEALAADSPAAAPMSAPAP